MLERMVGGAGARAGLAQCARGTLRAQIPQVEQALAGRCGPPQRFLVAQHLAHLAFLDEAIARASAEVAPRLAPLTDQIARSDTVPGLNERAIAGVLAESGTDLGRLPADDHLTAGAGLAAGHHETAGQRTGGKTRQGARWLRPILITAAHAAAKKKGRKRARQYHRSAARRGARRAAGALARTLLTIIYHLLTRGGTYHEEEAAVLDDQRRRRNQQRALDQLHALGVEVTITPRVSAAGPSFHTRPGRPRSLDFHPRLSPPGQSGSHRVPVPQPARLATHTG